MSIQNLISYEVLGAKEEFAGWVSNISPYETPFVSLTGKASINNKFFEWQTDRLAVVQNNAWNESIEHLPDSILFATEVHTNYTQILRKVVEVSDTANALQNHGRQSELEYQIEKATKEIKRDLESIFLSSQTKVEGDSTTPRQMSAFYRLVADVDEAEPTTGAVTHKRLTTTTFDENDIFDITENLHYSGARANVIMFHPSHAKIFSEIFEAGTSRVKLFNNEDKSVISELTEITDPLGQKYVLLPNRFMSRNILYFFHPHDWFQRVLRAPTATSLDKTGSSESWMLELEIGLQHRNRWASGILELSNYYGGIDYTFSINHQDDVTTNDTTVQLTYTSLPHLPDSVTWSSSDTSVATVDQNGLVTTIGFGDVTISASANYPFNLVQNSSVTFKVFGVKLTLSVPTIGYPNTTGLDFTLDSNVPSSVTSTNTYSSTPTGAVTINGITKHISIVGPGKVDISVEATYPQPYGVLRDTVPLDITGFGVRPNTLDVVLGTDYVIPESNFIVNPDTLNPSGKFIFTALNAWDPDYMEVVESGDATSGWVYTIHPKMGTSAGPLVQPAAFSVKMADDTTKIAYMNIRITGTNTFQINPYTAPVHSGDTIQLDVTTAGPATEVDTVWTSSNANVTVSDTGEVVVGATFKGLVNITAVREFDNSQKIKSIVRINVQ